MRIATIQIKGITPYSQSKAIQSEKKKDESHDDFDKRVWREHLHTDADGNVVLPAVAIGLGIANTAAYLSKGGELKKKGNATWSENFRCGLAVAKSPSIGITADEIEAERVYCNADGKRGSGKRVWRTFPMAYDWEATVIVHILDDTIPVDVFERVIEQWGIVNGIGRYRPQNGGYLGRFVVEKCEIK